MTFSQKNIIHIMILEMDMNLTFLFLEFPIGLKILYFVMACIEDVFVKLVLTF